MPGLTLVGAARGVLNVGAKTLTFARPVAAARGDVLLAILTFNSADSMTIPNGWTQLIVAGAPDRFSLLARMIDFGDPESIVFPLLTVANEWQGEIVALREGSPGTLRYAGNITTFTSTTALATPAVTTQQAIDLVMSVWSCSGAPLLTPPAGFTTIDNFSTAIVSSRSTMVAFKLAGATGGMTFPNANASTSTTGAAITQALRDRAPIQAPGLLDLVPGNIGLIGNDTRPAR
jgi:hypothetical protein